MGDVVQRQSAQHFPTALVGRDLSPTTCRKPSIARWSAQANDGLPVLHRYFKLRKQLLGIKDELGYYDIYPTMFPGLIMPQILGRGFRAHLARRARALWRGISRPAEEGLRRPLDPRSIRGQHKASGAYMNGTAYDVHPYLLLNHNDDYEALSTLRA